jgi:hypothetical protein
MSVFGKKPFEVSDTVTVTVDGRAIIDVRKLFAKKHVKDKLRRLQDKVVIVKPSTHPKERTAAGGD